jgi:tRNA dimethylallyltransferase
MDKRTNQNMQEPLLVIVGETASGKSALALDVATKFQGELICADSWTVYKEFDIGTAKPTATDRLKVPHHLLDVADPRDGFSAAVFQRMAKKVIIDITNRGKLPILVGGTGLYIDGILYDYGFLPPSLPGLREALNGMSIDELLGRANSLGLDLDGIDIRNKRRVIRLIENDGARPTRQTIRGNTLILGLQLDREIIKERIAKRIDTMINLGLEQEVKRLAARYSWDVEPMKGIGYREWKEYFEGTQSVAETRDRILKASNDLAKRQRTWFKRNPSIQWVHDRSNAIDILTTFLNKTN